MPERVRGSGAAVASMLYRHFQARLRFPTRRRERFAARRKGINNCIMLGVVRLCLDGGHLAPSVFRASAAPSSFLRDEGQAQTPTHHVPRSFKLYLEDNSAIQSDEYVTPYFAASCCLRPGSPASASSMK